MKNFLVSYNLYKYAAINKSPLPDALGKYVEDVTKNVPSAKKAVKRIVHGKKPVIPQAIREGGKGFVNGVKFTALTAPMAAMAKNEKEVIGPLLGPTILSTTYGVGKGLHKDMSNIFRNMSGVAYR